MKHLYLLRHGLAVPHGTVGVREEDRPLTAEGKKSVKQVAAGLRQIGIQPDRIVTSPLPRARETAQITADALGSADRLELSKILEPGVAARQILEWLMTRQETNLLLVGHNPNLTDLLALVIGLPAGTPALELKKGGVAALAGVGDHHQQLKWLMTPKLLRRLLD